MQMMMQTMQLVLYVAMLKFNLPPNLNNFISVFLNTVGFDILGQFVDWKEQTLLIFNFERNQLLIGNESD